MIRKPGPFQVIDGEGRESSDNQFGGPRRRFHCPHYMRCLDLAVALNWNSFTCQDCNGEMNVALSWRARHSVKRDVLVRSLCLLPKIQCMTTHEERTTPPTPLVDAAPIRRIP